MVKYFVSFDYCSWECGDGCCSDSWYDVAVHDVNGKFVTSGELRGYNYNTPGEWVDVVLDMLKHLDAKIHEVDWSNVPSSF